MALYKVMPSWLIPTAKVQNRLGNKQEIWKEEVSCDELVVLMDFKNVFEMSTSRLRY